VVPGILSVFIATNTYATNSPTYNLTNAITPIGNNFFIVGTSALNPQTGLFEETVTVTNLGTAVIHGLRLYVNGLRSGVTLYNATGTTNGVPYVEYDPPYNSPIYNTPPYNAPSNSVTFVLEFYEALPLPITNSLTAVAILEPTTATVINGVVGQIESLVFDNRVPNDERLLLNFSTISGHTYTVEYSSDLVTWNVARPSIVGGANQIQWYDDGPPETLSKPTFVGSTNSMRFYRVIVQ